MTVLTLSSQPVTHAHIVTYEQSIHWAEGLKRKPETAVTAKAGKMFVLWMQYLEGNKAILFAFVSLLQAGITFQGAAAQVSKRRGPAEAPY